MAMTSSLIEGDGFANVSVHTLNLMGNLLYPSFGAFIIVITETVYTVLPNACLYTILMVELVLILMFCLLLAVIVGPTEEPVLPGKLSFHKKLITSWSSSLFIY